jgi:hypothetical protein
MERPHSAALDEDDPPRARLVDEGVLVTRRGRELLVSGDDALDLGSALIALGKQKLLRDARQWPRPEEQPRMITVSLDGADDVQVNFAGLIALADGREANWRFAWELALDAIDSDHGSVSTTGWHLTVGRSRRLELALQLHAWMDTHAEYAPAYERDLAYLASRELKDRLLSL